MTDREAMQMALDALKQTRVFVTTREKIKHPEGTDWYDYTIEALRAQLEQGEQEPVAFLADATRFKVTLTERGCEITNLPRELGGRWVALVAAENDCHVKLTAPQQREWQGLTGEEIEQAYCSWDGFARAIEAKLKEKNT